MVVSDTPGEWSTRIRKRVRAKLAEHEVSATGIAKQLGWTQSYISRRLTARNPLPFSVADLEAIAGVLGVNPAEFTADQEPVGSAA